MCVYSAVILCTEQITFVQSERYIAASVEVLRPHYWSLSRAYIAINANTIYFSL